MEPREQLFPVRVSLAKLVTSCDILWHLVTSCGLFHGFTVSPASHQHHFSAKAERCFPPACRIVEIHTWMRRRSRTAPTSIRPSRPGEANSWRQNVTFMSNDEQKKSSKLCQVTDVQNQRNPRVVWDRPLAKDEDSDTTENDETGCQSVPWRAMPVKRQQSQLLWFTLENLERSFNTYTAHHSTRSMLKQKCTHIYRL